MDRITRILAAAAVLAAFDCGAAASRTGPSHARAFTSPVRAAPVIVRPVVVGYAPSYASRSPIYPAQSRTVAPLSYIPPASPDAPQFSMSGSPAVEGWHWQRVSLQQIDAEVRAKRAAAAAR
jgi:hypothetical protein